MKAPMPADVKAAIDARFEGDGMVSVREIAAELALAFKDDGKLIELMLLRTVVTECAKLGYPMKLTT